MDGTPEAHAALPAPAVVESQIADLLAQGRVTGATWLPCIFGGCAFVATSAAKLADHVLNDVSPLHPLPAVELQVLVPDILEDDTEMHKMLARHGKYLTLRASKLIRALLATATDAQLAMPLKAILTALTAQVRVRVLGLPGSRPVAESPTIFNDVRLSACSKWTHALSRRCD
jgi:hypothetical protein